MTLDVADCTDIKVDVDEAAQKLLFSATSGEAKYGLELELFEAIVKDESKWNTKGRNVIMSISKKDKEQEEWWPRLTKEKGKNPLITIDWAKWKDPDSEDEGANDDPMGGMDMNAMGGMGGMGGMPGMGGMGGMPGMEGLGGMGGMPGMGGGMPGMPGGMDPAQMAQMQQMMGGGMPGMPGGKGGMDPAQMAQMQQMMAGMGGMGMGGATGGDSDDEDGEEAQVDPHVPEKKADLDDLDGDETADLKK